jgi:hypothetical protein
VNKAHASAWPPRLLEGIGSSRGQLFASPTGAGLQTLRPPGRGSRKGGEVLQGLGSTSMANRLLLRITTGEVHVESSLPRSDRLGAVVR